MVYTTTKEVVQQTGIGVEINNELLGTGDNSEQSYDIKNRHVIAGTYTLYKAPASGDDVNDFTELTETTHYTLDKDSGRVLLTSAGVTFLGAYNLYAKYIHSPKISDTILATYIPKADEEVDRNTGAFWGTPEIRTDFFDGRKKFPYPTTDRPYNREDFDEPDTVKLTRRNITEINEVSFLKRGAALGNVQSYDADGASYTDNTSEANSPTGTSFFVFAETPATSDIIYIGMSDKFHGLTTGLFVTGAGSPTVTWEYYDGSSWTSFTPTESTTNASIFTAEGKFTWDSLSSWTKVSVNSSESLYFIRGRLTAGSYTTSPKALSITADQDSVLSKEIPLYDIQFNANGRVTFLKDRIPNGTKNVKITYKHGQTTTNPLITELSALYAGLRAYANITGGSYDDETGVTVGGVSVSIGEVYVNIREVISQFNKRIDQIIRQIGKRVHIAVA